jgi:hypothetical protein
VKPAPGESFLRVHWVAVPKATRARRANRIEGCLRWLREAARSLPEADVLLVR